MMKASCTAWLSSLGTVGGEAAAALRRLAVWVASRRRVAIGWLSLWSSGDDLGGGLVVSSGFGVMTRSASFGEKRVGLPR